MERQETASDPATNHAQKMAAVGHLAAGIAHEINTPIQFIGDNLHFLSDAFTDLARALDAHAAFSAACREPGMAATALAELDRSVSAVDLDFMREEIPKAIAQSLEGVQRVTAIVKAMKDFSHPDLGEHAPMDINQAVLTTLIVARNEYKYVAEAVTDLAPDLPLVRACAGAIQQVLLNLLVNAAHAVGDAVKARGDGRKGRITITTRHEGGAVIIALADTGTGIPVAIRDRIFDAFFTTKPAGRGTGQGLALSRQIVVQRHGGEISFTTEEGAGTTFTIRLPLEVRHG